MSPVVSCRLGDLISFEQKVVTGSDPTISSREKKSYQNIFLYTAEFRSHAPLSQSWMDSFDTFIFCSNSGGMLQNWLQNFELGSHFREASTRPASNRSSCRKCNTSSAVSGGGRGLNRMNHILIPEKPRHNVCVYT